MKNVTTFILEPYNITANIFFRFRREMLNLCRIIINKLGLLHKENIPWIGGNKNSANVVK